VGGGSACTQGSLEDSMCFAVEGSCAHVAPPSAAVVAKDANLSPVVQATAPTVQAHLQPATVAWRAPPHQ